MSARDDIDGRALVAEAVTEHLGERCDDFDPSCPTCRAWEAFDCLVEPGKLDAVTIEACAAICAQEGDEWDSDAVKTTKNYAYACRDRIRALEAQGGEG